MMDLSITTPALRMLWTDTCTVYGKTYTKDPLTGLSEAAEAAIVTDEPCRISYRAETDATDGHYADISQGAELFVRADLVIPEGARVEVTREGVTVSYERAGPAAVYASHREYHLSLTERYA